MSTHAPFSLHHRLRAILAPFALVVAGSVSGAPGAARAGQVQITADHVNLRACPSRDCEVVAQVSSGDILELRGGREGDWIQVIPPSGMAVWVHGELVSSNVVTVDRLRVRGGPGINYRAVAELTKGDRVTAIGVDGEWLRIAAPPSVSLWVSALYVRELELPGADPVPPASETVAALPRAGVELQRKPEVSTVRPGLAPMPGSAGNPLATAPEAIETVAGSRPGKPVQYRGTVRPAGAAVWRRPSRFQLVEEDDLGRPVTRCYLVADARTLGRLEGFRVDVTGREQWVPGVRYPVLVVETLQQAP